MVILKLIRNQWDRSLAIAALCLGALVLLIGYLGVSGTPFVAKQLPYFISAGFVGLFLLGIAAIAWLSADLRDEWRELRALRVLLEREYGPVDLRTEVESAQRSAPVDGVTSRRPLRAATLALEGD